MPAEPAEEPPRNRALDVFDDGSIRFAAPHSKDAADYIEPGADAFDDSHDRCGDCVHYIPGGGCHFVAGHIRPSAYCAEFYADYGVFAHEHEDHVEVNAELYGEEWAFDQRDIHDFVDEIEERLQQRAREREADASDSPPRTEAGGTAGNPGVYDEENTVWTIVTISTGHIPPTPADVDEVSNFVEIASDPPTQNIFCKPEADSHRVNCVVKYDEDRVPIPDLTVWEEGLFDGLEHHPDISLFGVDVADADEVRRQFPDIFAATAKTGSGPP